MTASCAPGVQECGTQPPGPPVPAAVQQSGAEAAVEDVADTAHDPGGTSGGGLSGGGTPLGQGRQADAVQVAPVERGQHRSGLRVNPVLRAAVRSAVAARAPAAVVGVAEPGRTSTRQANPGAPSQGLLPALAGPVGLELRELDEQPSGEPSGRRRGVGVLERRLEPTAGVLDPGHVDAVVGAVAAEPGPPPHHHHRDLTGLDEADRALDARAGEVAPGLVQVGDHLNQGVTATEAVVAHGSLLDLRRDHLLAGLGHPDVGDGARRDAPGRSVARPGRVS